jgi:hypothetical protein
MHLLKCRAKELDNKHAVLRTCRSEDEFDNFEEAKMTEYCTAAFVSYFTFQQISAKQA